MRKIHVIDSHTEGEPTRVVPAGQLEIEGGTMAERLDFMREHLDHFRRGLVLEPRGSEITVAAVLTPPERPGSFAGVIFCNNASYLGMCGHGSIGVVATLSHLGMIEPGRLALDTPAGTVSAVLSQDGRVEIENVPSFSYRKGVALNLESFGTVSGDIAYGGNWFFIVETDSLSIDFSNRALLDRTCFEIKAALERERVAGKNGAIIDHIELSQPLTNSDANSVNYVMCPGGEYDRSPCGTGTSAKVALLIEGGKLAPGEWYVQRSITGTSFRAKAEIVDGQIIPTIVGRAWIVSEGDLFFDEADPLRWGFS